MHAAWYDRQGPAGEVLQVGELPDPHPGPDEVRVQLTYSGVSPGDTKKRAGWLGSVMAYPRIVPHSDGAGVVDEVGPGVDPDRIGQRVWTHHAQSYRPSGTAAQYTVVPATSAVPLPDDVPETIGACLGIPGITAHRAVFADGPVEGRTVLVHGTLGAVGSLAAQLARRGDARVISTVRRRADLDQLAEPLRERAVSLDDTDPAAAIRRFAPDGVDRVVEVAFSANIELDQAVVGNGSVIAAYGSREDRPTIPFWPLLFDNVTLRLLGSDDFPVDAVTRAVADLSAAASELVIPLRRPLPLDRIAEAHEQVDRDNRHRVLLAVS